MIRPGKRVTRVAVEGEDKREIISLLHSCGLVHDSKRPQAVISYGGDGTALRAEARYPGTPRLPIRNSHICYHCTEHHAADALRKLAQGRFKIRDELKTEVIVHKAKGGRIARHDALNDVNLHYLPPTALRMRVQVNGKTIVATKHRHDEKTHALHDVFIGDGIVIATPHGSSGYFQSITRKTFTEGFAAAFNNPVHPARPLFLRPQDTLEIGIIRGPGQLFADNDPMPVALETSDRIVVRASKRKAHTIILQR